MAHPEMNRDASSHGQGWDDGLDHAAATDIGMRRANNQDAMAVELARDEKSWQARGHVFVVADGMGAHAAGELASKIAADSIPHLYRKYVEQSPPEALQKAVIEANAEIHRRGQANPEFHNMGTTASVLVLVPQGALLGHIGDSRVYRLRKGYLEQLTFDHSLVWEMRAAGQLSHDSEFAGMVPKNVITRSLGPNASVKVDIEGPFPVQTNDTFMICSDGLTGKVEDDELAGILGYLPPSEATRLLINLANLRGGPDNITLIVVRVTGDHLAAEGDESRSQIKPLTVGAVLQQNRVNVAVWVMIGVCILVAIVLLMTGYIPGALAAAAVGMAFIGLAVWQRYGGFSRGISLSEGRRLGRGPYVRVQLPPAAKFVSKFGKQLQEMRELAAEERWLTDPESFDRFFQQSPQKLKGEDDPQEALLALAQAAESLLAQYREMLNKATSDSAIDL